MPRNGSNVYSPPVGTLGVPNEVIASAKYNAFVNDLVADANLARPISVGGTGATTAEAARAALGVPGAASEITFTPAGGVAATSVQAAIVELDTEKASLSGATFTGGISGTTAAFTGGVSGTTGTYSGVVSGAAATANGHLLNRETADARYLNLAPAGGASQSISGPVQATVLSAGVAPGSGLALDAGGSGRIRGDLTIDTALKPAGAAGTNNQVLVSKAGAANQWLNAIDAITIEEMALKISTAIASMAYDAVGTFGYMYLVGEAAINPGTTVAGSSLKWTNGNGAASAATATGTWACLGYSPTGGVAAAHSTLFKRVA